jgi:hypothetical protein
MVLQIGRQYVATAPVISNGMIVLSAYTPFQVLSRSFSNKIEIAPVHKGKTGPKDRAEQVDLLDLLVLTLYPLERPEDREHGEDAPVADWMRGQLLFTNQDHTEGGFKVTGPHFWYIDPSDREGGRMCTVMGVIPGMGYYFGSRIKGPRPFFLTHGYAVEDEMFRRACYIETCKWALEDRLSDLYKQRGDLVMKLHEAEGLAGKLSDRVTELTRQLRDKEAVKEMDSPFTPFSEARKSRKRAK